MRRDPLPTTRHRGLLLPAVLAVSSFPPACGGKEGTTVATEASSESTGSTTEATPTSTEATPTSTTGGTTGGMLPDCPAYTDDPETCSSMVQCIFLINQSACIVRCDNFDDQVSCEQQMYCYWEGDCYLAV